MKTCVSVLDSPSSVCKVYHCGVKTQLLLGSSIAKILLLFAHFVRAETGLQPGLSSSHLFTAAVVWSK